LTLGVLLKRSRRLLWIGCALALSVHIGLSQLGVGAEEQRAAKPLTTQFVKRQPRLTKPLELKKRPQPKHRRVERSMVAVKARMQRKETGVGFEPTQLVRGLARPSVQIGRLAGPGGAETEPQALAGVIEGAKEAKNKIDMSLELLDIETLNTGRYHAMVVQDPGDKRNISGFLNLAYIYSDAMEGLGTYRSSDMTFYAVTRVAEKMNDWTQIKTRIAGRFTFDAPQLFDTPWVYTRGGHSLASWVIPYSQAHNLGKYLRDGGFWIADGLSRGPLGQDVPMRKAVKDALAAVDHVHGRDWDFQDLPFGHPLFHCFFEFPDGAPSSAGYWPVEGVFLGERLLVLYTNNNLVHGWVSRSPVYGDWYPDLDGTRVFQFSVNTIVFALTQEGSITYRLMGGVE
jgi:hypothetical protein